MSSPLDDVGRTLPQYLTPQNASQLADAIKKFPQQVQYYGPASDADPWQGDVFSGVHGVRVNENGLEFYRSRFMTVSNTCDMAEENDRPHIPHVCLAPIATVAAFTRLLVTNGIAKPRVDSLIAAMKQQQVTNVFYLPQGGGGPTEDLVVFLDALQSQTADRFRASVEKKREFSLSQVGWYLLLVKLAIHFCRAFEGQERQPPVKQPPAAGSKAARSWTERMAAAWDAPFA